VPIHELIASFLGNPVVFFLFVFGFSVLIAIILPIPIELFLIVPFVDPLLTPGERLNLMTLALVGVALGKAVGAWLVFLLGVKVEGAMHRWAERAQLFAKVLAALERFVRWSGSIGLYVLLSIPLMSDTAVLYFYALFNEEGKAIDQRLFIGSNFLAGINRVALVFILGLTIVPGLLNP